MKKLNKKILALALTTAFVAPVVGPAVVPAGGVIVAYASESIDNELSDLIKIAEAVRSTPEHKRIFDSSSDWLYIAYDKAKSALKSGNAAEKGDAANRLKSELNRPEIRVIVDKLGVNLPNNFTNYNEPSYKTELKQLITLTEYVRQLPEYKRIQDTSKTWLFDAFDKAKSEAKYGNEINQKNAINRLKAELNRPEVLKLVQVTGKSVPAGFNNYSEEAYHTELKELITLTGYVRALPEHSRLFDTSRTWLFDAYDKANNAARYGDEISQKNAANRLKTELNRAEIRPLVDSLGIGLPANFTNYTEPAYASELKYVITLANKVMKLPEYDRSLTTSKSWLFNAWDKAQNRARYGDELEQKEASNRLKAELNRSQIRPLVDQLGLSLPAYVAEFSEESYETELKRLVTISEYVRKDSEFKSLSHDNQKGLNNAFDNGVKQSKNGDRIDINDAIDLLNQELNKYPIKPIYDRYKDKVVAGRVRTTGGSSNQNQTPAPSNNMQVDQAKIDQLKQSIKDHETMVNSALLILNNYPATIKGKEKQLVDILLRAQKLRERSAKVLANTTGEKIVVEPLKIPEKYRHLAN